MRQKIGKKEMDVVMVTLDRRRREALDLRIQGYTYQQIADFIMTKYGIDMDWYTRREAWADVDFLMKEARKDTRERATELLEIELARLDKLQHAAWEAAMSGSVRSIEVILKIMARRSAYLGLDMPVKQSSIGNWKEEIAGLLKAGKITADQIETEFGREILDELLVTMPVRQISEVVDIEAK